MIKAATVKRNIITFSREWLEKVGILPSTKPYVCTGCKRGWTLKEMETDLCKCGVAITANMEATASGHARFQ